MNKIFFITISILICMFINMQSGYAKNNIKIAFICETNLENNIFWAKTAKYMQKAADDLDIDLKIYNLNDNFLLMKDTLSNLAKSPERPDAVIFYNVKQQGKVLIPIAEKFKLPIFLMNADLSPEEKEIIGDPREKYKYFIGKIIPDEKDAGYKLAKELFKNLPSNKKFQLIAIKGPKYPDYCSDSRIKGLLKALSDHKNIHLKQIVAGNWLRKTAKNKFIALKKIRYPEAYIVWSACDAMALGVIDGAKELGLKPGNDLLIGGIDWIDEAFDAIKKGTLCSSAGGHFMEGAWTMVLLHDYFKGKDFATESPVILDRMVLVTKDNVNLFKEKLTEENINKLDFKRFSKIHNPDIKDYDFSVKKLLKEL